MQFNSSEPQYFFSLVNHSRDNIIQNWFSATFKELAETLVETGFQYTDDKADSRLISPWQFKQKGIHDFRPASTQDDVPILDANGEEQVGRYADNVLGTNMLMLDYDGTMTIEQAKKRFQKYSYILYTTHSHKTARKGGKDCFRVILPLKTFLPYAMIELAKTGIIEEFCDIPSTAADRSFITKSRCFFLPSCPESMKEHAVMLVNHGQLFDASILRKDLQPKHAFNSKPVQKTYNTAVDHVKLVESLKTVFFGNDNDWFSLSVAMASNGFTQEQFVEVSSFVMNQKTPAHAVTKWKAAVKRARQYPTNVGVIINLIKRNGGKIVAEASDQPTVSYKKKRELAV